MNDYKIIELLCSSQPENIQLAEQICKEQEWDIFAIINKYGYSSFGLEKPKNFLLKVWNCSGKNLTHLPDLLPVSLKQLNCSNNKLLSLPANLPPNLKVLNCSDNELLSLPPLPPFIHKLLAGNNPFQTLPDLKIESLSVVEMEKVSIFNRDLLLRGFIKKMNNNWEKDLSKFGYATIPTASENHEKQSRSTQIALASLVFFIVWMLLKYIRYNI